MYLCNFTRSSTVSSWNLSTPDGAETLLMMFVCNTSVSDFTITLEPEKKKKQI